IIMVMESRQVGWQPPCNIRPYHNRRTGTRPVPDGVDWWSLVDDMTQAYLLPWPHKWSDMFATEDGSQTFAYPYILEKFDKWRKHEEKRFHGLSWPTHIVHDIDGQMDVRETDPQGVSSPSIFNWLRPQLNEWERRAREEYDPPIDMHRKLINPGHPNDPVGVIQRWVRWTSHILACLPRAYDAWRNGYPFTWPQCEDVPAS
ncbi:MAG: hypothetical protein ACYSUI_15930, partial [Planctomycetota bacterium]